MRTPFRYFDSSPEVVRLTVMMCVRHPLSLRQVKDLLFERRIDICRGWHPDRISCRRESGRISERGGVAHYDVDVAPCSRSGSKTILQAAHRPRFGTLEFGFCKNSPDDMSF
jgi:hypothetical protein